MAETVATYTVPEHYVSMFTSNIEASLQKRGGKLRGLVTSAAYSGEKVQVVDFIGPVEFLKRDTPYQDTVITEPEHTSRWIAAEDYDVALLIDRIDTLRMIYDPTNPYVERVRDAYARTEDQVILDSFFAVAKAGKLASVNVPFPAADVIPNGGTGMSVAKLRATRKLLKKRFVDLEAERPYIIVTSDEIDALLGETSTTSSDYAAVKALVDGEISNFMGFTFVPAEGWPSTYTEVGTGFTIRQLPVWVKSGMHLGTWQNLTMTINNRPDKNNIKQIHGCMTMGATRLEEGKVLDLEVKVT